MNADDNMRRGNKYVLNEENFEAIIGMFRRWIFVLFKIKSIFTVEINTIKRILLFERYLQMQVVYPSIFYIEY